MKLWLSLLALAGMFALGAAPAPAQSPDTLMVFDAAAQEPGGEPAGWEHRYPEDLPVYTTYVIERSIEGRYLRARSNASASWLERSVGEVDVADYPFLEWEWKVDRFPDVRWEQDAASDDFALRIELVFDFPGGPKNPLNILRKGPLVSLFEHYPPEQVLDYVWAVNVPVVPYPSPYDEKRTLILPVESGPLAGYWLRERIDLAAEIQRLHPSKHLVLKTVRIIADTDQSGSMSDAGIRYIRLVGE